jgi:hypothetical protein
MAVRAWTVEQPPAGEQLPTGEIVFLCTGLLVTDTTAPLRVTGRPIRTIQISGTPGAGGSLTMQASLSVDGTPVWGTAHDPQGNDVILAAADITAQKIETLLEDYIDLRGNATAGDGATLLTLRVKLGTIARR